LRAQAKAQIDIQNMNPLSNHYLTSTTTDYDINNYATGYHVTHLDIMPVFTIIIIFLMFMFMRSATLGIVKKIIKKS